jgi:hypothetical protein
MKPINQSSRRQFIKAGGIFIAASGVATAVNAFAKEEEKKNEEVSPPEDLMREHGILKRILLIYGEAIRRIEANQDLPPEPLAESATIIREFVEDYHEKLEEDFVFPRFKKANKLVDLVDVLFAAASGWTTGDGHHDASRDQPGLQERRRSTEACRFDAPVHPHVQPA